MFLTGTRADFGKLKSLMLKLCGDDRFEVHVFVTGMHMLSLFGSTWDEVRKAGLPNIYRFINQNHNDSMDQVLSKTVGGLSDYVKEMRPDLIVVHGDRVEALAGAIVGALSNIRVAHIEGGEVSGTVDELIRHAVSKLSHLHFVANDVAFRRLIQLGEARDSIHVIGSPDVDIMNSPTLPSIEEVKRYYGFDFDRYAILMFHPVTTEVGDIPRQVRIVVDQVLASGRKFVVLFPNNDQGSDSILMEYERLRKLAHVAVYPSMRFEYFLTLLKNADFLLGNSSAGAREAPHFGVPAINLGSRQNNRVQSQLVIDVAIDADSIASAMRRVMDLPRVAEAIFGNGNSAEAFHETLTESKIWARGTQKYFIDSHAGETGGTRREHHSNSGQ
jgi:UDP-N-acetylglucosamine 2-epimerase (hydrolysing)